MIVIVEGSDKLDVRSDIGVVGRKWNGFDEVDVVDQTPLFVFLVMISLFQCLPLTTWAMRDRIGIALRY